MAVWSSGATFEALCALAPPEAIAPALHWLTVDYAEASYGRACALMLFKRAPEAFAQVAATRFVIRPMDAEGRRSIDDLAYYMASDLPPEALVQLLPLLQTATTEHIAGRDALYATLCAREPARSATVCDTFPAKLEETWSLDKARKSRRTFVLVSAALALLYVGIVLLDRRSIGWPAAAIGTGGTAAIGGAILAFQVMSQSHGGDGALNALTFVFGVASAIIAAPIFAVGGTFLARLLVRAGVPVIALCMTSAILSVLLVTYAYDHW